MKFIRKIWSDPVGSKLISTGIITLIGLLWISVQSLVGDQSLFEVLNKFWSIKISIGWVSLLVVFAPIIYLLVTLTYKKFKRIDYSTEHKELDKTFFLKIRDEFLPSNEAIAYLRMRNFGAPFKIDKLDQLEVFEQECNANPDLEFIDSELEDLKLNLIRSIQEFSANIAVNTFTHEAKIDLAVVPSEWSYEQPERYNQVIRELNKSANEVRDAYDNLIRVGRRKLWV